MAKSIDPTDVKLSLIEKIEAYASSATKILDTRLSGNNGTWSYSWYYDMNDTDFLKLLSEPNAAENYNCDPEDFKLAAKLLLSISAAKRALANNNIEDAMSFMDAVANTHQEIKHVLAAPSVLRGQAVINGASKGGKSRAIPLKKKKEWQRQADKMFEINPNLSKNAVAMKIAVHDGGNPDTIRKFINKPKLA